MSTHDDAPVLITAALLRDWPLPDASGSKRSRGSVQVVGGGPSTPGGAILAGRAALRVGAGVLALAVDATVRTAVGVAVPEAAVHTLEQMQPDADVVLLGPGLDDIDVTKALLGRCVEDGTARLVLDAYALGALATGDLDTVPEGTVLTPNSDEAALLLGVDELDGEPVDAALRIAERYRAVVSFSGCIASPDGRRWQVPTGHAGLGTGGSGDVLSGAIAGLLARGADPEQAACWGTYVHATAGDRLAARVGRLGFLAGELADELPVVLVETDA